jgi:hypothetical protein
MAFEEYHKETYTPDLIQELADTAGIESASLEVMRHDLEEIAAIYRWGRLDRSDHVTNKEAKRELVSTAKRAAQLARQVETMSHEAWTALQKQIHQDTAKSVVGTLEGPSLFVPIETEANVIGIEFDRTSIAKLLHGIDIAATNGIEQLGAQRTGRVHDMAINVWVSNIHELWLTLSPHPFSRGVTDANEPVSPAARFVALAFAPIDPSYPTSRLMLAMKTHISEVRAQKRKN